MEASGGFAASISLSLDITLGNLDSYSFEVPDFASAVRLLYRCGVPAVAKRYISAAKKYGIEIKESSDLENPEKEIVKIVNFVHTF